MPLPHLLVACALLLVVISGCDTGLKPTSSPSRPVSEPGGLAVPVTPSTGEQAAAEPASGSAAREDAGGKTVDEATPEPAGPQRLLLDGIELTVPASWRKVAPKNRIIEAEFVIPRAADDEDDGRLTMLGSSGDREEVIALRTSEFIRQPGENPRQTMVPAGDKEAVWLDLRGEWRGAAFDRLTAPRAGYRMILAIIPFSATSGFYIKLVGPRQTVADHEAELREVVRTAKVTIPSPVETQTPREPPAPAPPP